MFTPLLDRHELNRPHERNTRVVDEPPQTSRTISSARSIATSSVTSISSGRTPSTRATSASPSTTRRTPARTVHPPAASLVTQAAPTPVDVPVIRTTGAIRDPSADDQHAYTTAATRWRRALRAVMRASPPRLTEQVSAGVLRPGTCARPGCRDPPEHQGCAPRGQPGCARAAIRTTTAVKGSSVAARGHADTSVAARSRRAGKNSPPPIVPQEVRTSHAPRTQLARAAVRHWRHDPTGGHRRTTRCSPPLR
jgi:hypothetical protein